MQDWFRDCHETFACTVQTMVELYKNDFSACATCEQQPWFSFFFDGTGNNRKIDESKLKLSNIARLFDGHVEDRPLIRRLYYPGVGTPLNASDPSWWEKVRDSESWGGGAGLGSDARLTKAEEDLQDNLRLNHHVTRIDIAIFGFSRGATLARAFVNRLLAKCEMKDGVPHWPCSTAIDGESAPLHFRFLGLFDTVESVGLPTHNLTDMRVFVPEQVERCLHIVSGHELRAVFPLTSVRSSRTVFEEIVFPGVHSDVGGGYQPDEQARSDLLARIALNRIRLVAVTSGVPFTPPAELDKTTSDLFDFDADVKTLFDEYMKQVGTGSTLEEQVFQHMRLYYGWLRARVGKDLCDFYRETMCTDPNIKAEVQRVQSFHKNARFEMGHVQDRVDQKHAWDRPHDPRYLPLTPLEQAYWDAWLNPPELSPGLLRFFDQYVHDSRAGFSAPDGGGYFRPRQIIDARVPSAVAAQTGTAVQPAMSAA